MFRKYTETGNLVPNGLHHCYIRCSLKVSKVKRRTGKQIVLGSVLTKTDESIFTSKIVTNLTSGKL